MPGQSYPKNDLNRLIIKCIYDLKAYNKVSFRDPSLPRIQSAVTNLPTQIEYHLLIYGNADFGYSIQNVSE